MNLPSREEIAEMLDRVPRVCAGRHYGDGPFTHAGCLMIPDVVGQADALLARLRPAWEELSQRAQDWGVMFDKSREHAATLSVERDALRADLAEEQKIVDRVWKALGISRYEDAGGKSIDELVVSLRADLARKEEQHAETRGLVRDLTTVLEKRNADLRECGEALSKMVQYHRVRSGPSLCECEGCRFADRALLSPGVREALT